MTKTDLIEKVSAQTRFSKPSASAVVNSVLENIARSIASGETVSIHGFGKFEPVEKAARPGRNPRTGETVTIPARNAVKFTAAKQLKDALI